MFRISVKELIQIGLIILGQIILTNWALTLVAPPDGISLMWLPDGYLLGMLLLLPQRLWLPLIAASFSTVISIELLLTDRPLSLILGFATANFLEGVGGAYLYARFASNPRRFDEFKDLAIFVAGCVLILPAMSASLGAYNVVEHGFSDDFMSVYKTWYMSAGLGILFVAPLVLYLSEWFRQVDKELLNDQVPLFIAISLTAVGLFLPLFFPEQLLEYYPLLIFVTIPVIIWSALRYELLGALMLSSLVVIITVQLSAMGLGPFSAESATSAEAVVRLQSYLASVIMASMFTGLAVEKLGRARDRIKLLLDTSPNGIQENSIDGTITYANPALHDIAGLEQGSLVGKPIWHNALDDSAVKDVQDYLSHLVTNTPVPEPYYTQIRHASGRIQHIEVVWEYQWDKSGQVKGFTSIISDITSRVKADEQLQRTQKMEALGKLTGGIAHDYNNMLGIILGYTELLKGTVQHDPKLLKYVEQIHQAGKRSANLTGKLLSFSRKKSANLAIADLNQLISDRAQMLEKIITARIQLDLELTPDLWPVRIDEGDFEDALINMTINAMHAIEDAGTITIATSQTSMNQQLASNHGLPAGDYIQISYSDTGTGMTEEVREKIFEPFFSTKGENGTGLGLSQVYGFVARSGGEIEVFSEPGKGTYFHIFFPRYVSRDESNRHMNNSLAEENLAGTETLLVVDDEPALLSLTSEVLELSGYNVHTSQSAKEALEILKTTDIDLVLSDVIMPNMDGYQFADAVLKLYPEMKILLASGYSDESQVKRNNPILEEKMIRKPYATEVLLKAIRTELDTALVT